MYVQKGCGNLKQEPSTGQLQLVLAEANTYRLIKFDGWLKGHKADLWQGYIHMEIPPTSSSLDGIRQIETVSRGQNYNSISPLHHSF